MPIERPFRFAADIHATTRAALLARVQLIEELGYSTIITGEHPTGDMLGQTATLTAVAMTSTKLSVASQVFANDFRNPVLLARELATIDILAEGRFEFGIGTGWARDEYQQIGIAYDPPTVRVDRFAEALQVFKGAFSGEPFSFTGTHYTIQNHTGLKSFQRPHPRLYYWCGWQTYVGTGSTRGRYCWRKCWHDSQR
jgi:alkanesulfonate monooxygenase SsuD/methylene tetrahydromethanopterin reductase-like flavin-dependent oxidoreductase (luciferase family)